MNKIKVKYYKNSCFYGDFLKDNDWFVFLDSCNDISGFGRYDILSSNPHTKITTFGNLINVRQGDNSSSFYDNPQDVIKKYFNIKSSNSDLPFNNGMIGYFGYDAFEKKSQNKKFPDIAIGFYDWAIIVDHLNKESWLTFETKTDFISRIIKLCNNFNPSPRINYNAEYTFTNFKNNTSYDKYIDDVTTIKNYITNGDCYQVNYSQNFEAHYIGDPWDIYKDLRVINPAPYSSYLKFDDSYFISSSPERFISIKNNIVETKPIKGTLKRLKDPELDLNQIKILRNDEKNIAENLMIVDLLRNDISKCCELNSVKVEKLFDIETYASVHHMVTTIVGMLKPNISSVDILKACFPGGSITGAPKKRAMQIISELEESKRNIYCGSIGYFNENNNMDTNICIRTIALHNNTLNFSAGGGIVYDSVPVDEYHESLQKVSIFIKFFSNGDYKW